MKYNIGVVIPKSTKELRGAEYDMTLILYWWNKYCENVHHYLQQVNTEESKLTTKERQQII